MFVVASVIGFRRRAEVRRDRSSSRRLRTVTWVIILNNANILHLDPSWRAIPSAPSVALALGTMPSNNYRCPFTSLPTNINLAFFSRLNSLQLQVNTGMDFCQGNHE